METALFKTIVAIKNKDLLFFNSGISVNSECFRFIRNVRECFGDMGDFQFNSFDDFSTYLQSNSLEKQENQQNIIKSESEILNSDDNKSNSEQENKKISAIFEEKHEITIPQKRNSSNNNSPSKYSHTSDEII